MIAVGRPPSADTSPNNRSYSIPLDCSVGSQVPRRILEQVRAGVLDARCLGARQRVPTDEPLVVVDAVEHGPLDRADVADHAVARARKRLAHDAGQHPHGRAHEARLGARHRFGRPRRAALSMAPQLERALERARVGVVAAHLRPIDPRPRGQADRAPDQADAEKRDPGQGQAGVMARVSYRADSSLPTTAATRCTCST